VTDGTRIGTAAQLDPATLAVVAPEKATLIKQAAFAAAAPAVAPLAPAGVPAARPIRPGVERWPVKTGADQDADRVGTNDFAGAGSEGVVETTVEELVSIPRPVDMSDIRGFQEDFQDRRAEPVELIVWRVRADITVIKKEGDGDLHLVLQGDSGRTMIAEAPMPRPPFVERSNPWFGAMETVRRQLAEQFGASFAAVSFKPLDGRFMMPASPVAPVASPPAAPAAASGLITTPPGVVEAFEALAPFEAKVPRTPVTITGVGFFDRVHGQTGVALRNGIELHPILAITFD
jgi:hypothetical protein